MNELRRDQITLETRIIGGSVILVLLLAFFALYIEPDHTDLNFACVQAVSRIPFVAGLIETGDTRV